MVATLDLSDLIDLNDLTVMSPTRTFSLWALFATVSAGAQVSVGSFADADRSLALRWVAAPATVVPPGAESASDRGHARGQAVEELSLPVHDSTIVAGISAGFASDPYLRERPITVLAVNGGVVLRGAVSNTAARNQASMLARSVDGVVDVTNDLSVQPLHD